MKYIIKKKACFCIVVMLCDNIKLQITKGIENIIKTTVFLKAVMNTALLKCTVIAQHNGLNHKSNVNLSAVHVTLGDKEGNNGEVAQSNRGIKCLPLLRTLALIRLACWIFRLSRAWHAVRQQQQTKSFLFPRDSAPVGHWLCSKTSHDPLLCLATALTASTSLPLLSAHLII